MTGPRICGFLDPAPEERFDRVTRLAARILRCDMAAIAILDGDHIFFKSRFGFAESDAWQQGEGGAATIRSNSPIVVPDLLDDDRFEGGAPVLGSRQVRFFAGVPLSLADGRRVGTLCGFDTAARTVTPADVEMLHDLAAIVSHEFDASFRAAQEEERIRCDRNRFRALVEASSQVVCVATSEGEIREITPAWHRLTGQSTDDVQRGGWARLVHPDDGIPLLPRWRNAVRAKQTFESVLRIRVRSGAYRWFSFRAVPILNTDGTLREYVGCFADIHERQEARERMRQDGERLRLAFEATRMGMWEWDLTTDQVHLSTEAHELLGTSADAFDVEAWKRLEYVHQADRPALKKAACAIVNTEAFELAFEHRTRGVPDGQERWVRSISRKYHNAAGEPTRLIGTLVDITPAKRFEMGLLEAKERAEEMVRLKDTFLANISHEIRTPLTAILGFTDLLRAEAPPELHDFAELIEAGGKRLNETLASILELAQLNAGAFTLRPSALDVAAIALQVEEQYRPVAERRGLRFSLEMPERMPALFTDRHGFVRIVECLVSNAIKFTEQGAVAVSLEADESEVRVRVRDTGCGISPAFMPHLFSEFRQESIGLSRSHEGAGLGLTIAHRLAEAMKGRISVESAVGSGSVFTLHLPR